MMMMRPDPCTGPSGGFCNDRSYLKEVLRVAGVALIGALSKGVPGSAMLVCRMMEVGGWCLARQRAR